MGSSTSSSGSNRGLMYRAHVSTQPSKSVITQQASRMPRYLPMKNCRRLTGLLMTVMAVRPSISSFTEMLAVKRPNRPENSITASNPTCFISL